MSCRSNYPSLSGLLQVLCHPPTTGHEAPVCNMWKRSTEGHGPQLSEPWRNPLRSTRSTSEMSLGQKDPVQVDFQVGGHRKTSRTREGRDAIGSAFFFSSLIPWLWLVAFASLHLLSSFVCCLCNSWRSQSIFPFALDAKPTHLVAGAHSLNAMGAPSPRR